MVVTRYVYDGDQILEEKDGAGALQATYIYGPWIDEALTMTRNGQTYYYFYDGLGSVSDLTNAAGEVVESYRYDVYGIPSQPSLVGNRYLFTGREYDQESGLYHYRARGYHPGIGRFGQRDPWTHAPDDERFFLNPIKQYYFNRGIEPEKEFYEQFDAISEAIKYLWRQDILMTGKMYPPLLHRYNYVFNNPTNWIDPWGFTPWYQEQEIQQPGIDQSKGGRRPGKVPGGGKQKPGRWHPEPKGPKWPNPKPPPLPQPKPGGGEGGKPWPHPWPPWLGGGG